MPNADYSEFGKENRKKKKSSGQEDWQQELANHVLDEWTRGQQYVSPLNDMYNDIYRMLRGERPEKNYDWQSNIVINKVFQVVWTAISYLAKKIHTADPIIAVEGFNKRECWKREMLLQRWNELDGGIKLTIMSLLRLLLNGYVVRKKTWDQEISTGGVPKKDKPHTVVLDNLDVVVDWALRPGQSCTEGRFIIHREMVDLGTLMRSGINYFDLDKISAKTAHEPNHEDRKQIDKLGETPKSTIYTDVDTLERQGLLPIRRKDGNIRPVLDLDEIAKDDVEYAHMIVTVANGSAPVLIRFEENTYDEMTFVDGHLYFDPERWASVGMIEPMKDMQTALNDNINAMFDEIGRNLFPPTIANKYAQIDWDTIEHAPGQIWLTGGDPNTAFAFPRPSNVTSDAWMKHQMFDNEIRLTSSITPPMQGMGAEKTATQGVLNAQFSSSKLDLLLSIYEETVMIPDAKQTMRFAQKFAHPATYLMIVGEPVQFDRYAEEFKYCPRASSVKMQDQKEQEVREDLQLMQIVGSIQNPGSAKILNMLLANILRNKGMPVEAQLFDEKFFEPQTPAGMLQMMGGGIAPGAQSNQRGVPMTGTERRVRGATDSPVGMNLQ